MEDPVLPMIRLWNEVYLLFVQGNMRQALEVFARMKRLEVQPNELTYTTLIDSYRQNEGMGKALEVLTLMQQVCLDSFLSNSLYTLCSISLFQFSLNILLVSFILIFMLSLGWYDSWCYDIYLHHGELYH